MGLTIGSILRIIIAFTLLWLGIRVLGKKEMGKLTYQNLATSAAMGSLTATLAVDNSINILIPIAGLLGFFFLTYIFSYLSLHSYSARKLFEGAPTLLISKGEILENNLKSMRLSTDNLMAKLREKNAFAVTDVEFAVMETDGKLSVLLKSENQPVTPKTLIANPQNQALPLTLIKDGAFIEENLLQTGLTKATLEERLQASNVSDISDVFLVQIDASGQLYIDFKNDPLTEKTTLS